MKNKILEMTVFAFVFLSLCLTACDVSLGSQINIKGPVVRITSPVLIEEQEDIPVRESFNVAGTAQSANGVARMEIKLDFYDRYSRSTLRLGREWKFESNKWHYKKDTNMEWCEYLIDEYQGEEDIEEHYWRAENDTVYWNIPVLLDGLHLSTGDVFITVSAWDRPGNHDSGSTDKIKVYYINNEPSFFILSPGEPVFRTDMEGDFRNPDVPQEFYNYVYDPLNNPDATMTYIRNWITDEPWQIRYLIDDEATLPLTLKIEFTNKHHIDLQDDKITYYEDSIIIDYRTGYINIGAIAQGMNLNKDEPTYMQIVTRLSDSVGNEQFRSHGYFAYLPDAVKPWTVINFAYMPDENNPPENLAPENYPSQAFILKNSTNRGSIAYGKHFLESVSWTIYGLFEDSLEETGFTRSGSVPYSGDRYTQGWDFESIEDYGTGPFRMEVTVKDKNNNEGTYFGYFNIESNATPKVQKILTDLDNPLFGSNTGVITIKGIAEIESDLYGQVNINRVTLAWIRPDSPNSASARVTYTDRTFSNWNNATPGGYHDTANGVVIWELASNEIISLGKNDSTQLDEYEFSKDLNLFSQLNIGIGAGKFPISQMDFIVRVASSAETPSSPKSSTFQFTTFGDIQSPSIVLTKIHIHRDGSAVADELSYPLADSMISTIKKDDTIWFEGTWNDNSRTSWSGLSEQALRNCFGSMTVIWKGETEIPFTISALYANPGGASGTWVTSQRHFTENNTDPIVFLNVSLSDLSNNHGSINPSFMIETDNPTLVLISSTTSDGIYGNNKETDLMWNPRRPVFINLVFNKPVKFFDNVPPTAANAPRLMLNNNGRAFYYEGNNTSTFTFIYYVDGQSGHSLGVNGLGGGSSDGRLNVIGIEENDFPLTAWVSVEAETRVNIPAGVFDPGVSTSLAGNKNIVIDKGAPAIINFTSTTAAAREHGKGSSININVNFNEPVIVNGATAENLRLNLSGITGSPAAIAHYTNVTGPTSIGFTYTVANADNSQNTGTGFVGVAGVTMGSGVTIRDEALNDFTVTAVADGTIYNNQTPAHLQVKTSLPQAPSIDTAVAGTHYGNTSFHINDILSSNAAVEYTLNYTGAGSVWTTLTQAIHGTVGNYYAIIPLSVNGGNQIAARQYDNANPRNLSGISNVVSVTLDKGNLLERITSSTPDGIYGTGTAISIDLVFRKAVYFSGMPSNATLTLNNGQTASLPNANSHSADYKTWTFTFNSAAATPTAINNDRLDVTAINISTVTFSDAQSGGTNVNSNISLAELSADNRLRNQKSIKILTGNPEIATPTLGGGIIYSSANNTLRFTFNRDIYAGDTNNKAVIRQVAANFRIPAVLTVEQYNALFTGRSDLNDVAEFTGRPGGYASNAAWWQWIGQQLYQEGTNGATSAYVSDTSVKYILRYDISTSSDTLPAIHADMPAYAALKTLFREAEALRFDVNDREVTIAGQIITLNLTGAKALPVKGVTYQVKFPNGFVKDFLENPNGGYITGDYVDLSTLVSGGVETPFIRINKGENREVITGTGNNRQAVQPLTSTAKIDCRTPTATLTYRIQQTTDNIGRLIWRANPTWFVNAAGTSTTNQTPTAANGGTMRSNRLPNLGSQVNSEYESFNATKNRPQTGESTNGTTDLYTGRYPNGYNMWIPMAAMPGNYENYTVDQTTITVGTNNYNDGGMIIHLEARAVIAAATAYYYEAAYRSVFVFNNVAINGNAHSNQYTNVGTFAEGGSFSSANGVLARMWIRGGDNTMGNPSVPDFPINRDRSQPRMARLLTPIQVNTGATPVTIGPTGNTVNFNNLANATSAEINNNHIPAAYGTDGYYLWFWVTWKLNVNAYIDLFAGELPVSDNAAQVPQNQKDMYYSYIMAKEHFPVIPGRTTVVGVGTTWDNYVDGGHGALRFGSVTAVPVTTD